MESLLMRRARCYVRGPSMDSGAKEQTQGKRPKQFLKGVLALIGIGFLALDAGATDVVLRNGASYTGVTIVSRTASAIQMKTNFGEVTIPLSAVASIDGQPIGGPLATPAPARTLGISLASRPRRPRPPRKIPRPPRRRRPRPARASPRRPVPARRMSTTPAWTCSSSLAPSSFLFG